MLAQESIISQQIVHANANSSKHHGILHDLFQSDTQEAAAAQSNPEQLDEENTYAVEVVNTPDNAPMT